MATPPQPSPDRLPEFARHPVLIGITENPSPLLVEAGARLAQALNAPHLHLAWADPSRDVASEDPDGTVHHVSLDADGEDGWEERDAAIRESLRPLLTDSALPWSFHYLAGRPDRALTHLARAVDAGLIVVGTRGPGLAERLREHLSGPVATHLAHHQHRPVVAVPLSVVDWKEPLP